MSGSTHFHISYIVQSGEVLFISQSLIGLLMDAIGSEVVKELVKQLFVVSRKAYRCRGIAENLATMLDEVQPSIQEILDSGVEMSHHRQNQLHEFFDNLEKCRMLTEKVLRSNRWNMVEQISYVNKMEDLDKKISSFVRGPLSINVLADVHHIRGAVDRMNRTFEQLTQDTSQVRFDLIDMSAAEIHHVQADSGVRFDRIDRSADIHHVRPESEVRSDQIDSLNETLGSLNIRGSESMREVMKLEEATTEMTTDGYLGNLRVTELVRQLYAVSQKEFRYRGGIARKLATMIEDLQPNIREIQYSGVELSPHRQAQLRRFSETLEKCRKITYKVLKSSRWNMVRQLIHVRKLENLESKISSFLNGHLLLHVLADIHHVRNDPEVQFDRIDRSVDSLNEELGSMIIRGSESMREVMNMEEATTEMTTDGDLGNLGVGLELGKRKVKEMLFKSNDEERLIGISGMSGSGKTTLAKELARDEEVRGHFGNNVLFLTVSQSPALKELRALIWGFLTGYEAASQTRKLVILDDVWTRKSLDQLLFENIPGTTTLVVSRSKLVDSRATYDVELLNEHEATSLFCLSAFDQKSVPSGFSRSLVKQVVDECKGLPLALKVIGASLKDRPEKYWQGAANRLSRGEPADENYEIRVFAQIEASLEILDPKTRECFLDLGAFPEDKKIPLDVIINMWVELHDIDEETAFSILLDLSDKNLVTLVKDPRFGAMYTCYYDIFVMQHDVLRDLALRLTNRGKVNRRKRLSMPKRESKLPRAWERSNDEPYNARVVSIHTGEMNEMDWFDMEFPKAEVLILNFSSDNYVLPPFIAKMGRLRALLIINNGRFHVRLQDFSSFTNLAKLRSLWLEMVYVPHSTVPLKNLQKVSLILCKINTSVDQTALDMNLIFPNLSDLTIDHCEDLVELSSTISGITSLNSISITNCPCIGELPKNLSKLMALELLRLYACPELKSLPEELCELPSLKYLDISQCVSLSFLPEDIGKLRTLEKIDMRACPLLSLPSSAVKLTSLCHVICDKENLCMWEEVENAVPGLRVEAAENCLD